MPERDRQCRLGPVGLALGLLLSCALSAFWPGPAQGEDLELGGITLKRQVEIAGQDRPLRLSGAYQVQRAFLPFQLVALYLPARPPAEAELLDGLASFRLELVWLGAGLDAARTRKYWEQGFASVIEQPEGRERMSARIAELERLLGPAERGRRWGFDYTPDGGLELSVDGVPRGRMAGIEFVRLLLAQFIGPRAPIEQRERLLEGLRARSAPR